MGMPGDTSAREEYDVAIIGCGPVGEILSIVLAQHGVRSVAIEREPGIYSTPRAVALDDEVMRIYQNLGVADQMSKVLSRMVAARFINEAGQLLLGGETGERSNQGWGEVYLFHQPHVEEILHARMIELGAEVRYGTEVTAIEEDAEEVRLSCRVLGKQEQSTVTARYAVGCDGGTSFTRHAIGSTWDRLAPSQRWLCVDVLEKRDLGLGNALVGYCWTSRPHLYVPKGHGRHRWEFMLLEDDDPERLASSEGVWDLLDRYVSPEDVELERTAVYNFRSLVAAPWRRGRVFLAGDAAHLQPPMHGQGLCSGVRDAVNLGWKLAAVLHGRAREELLDTYESERRAHAAAWIRIATEISEMMNTLDPEVAARRDEHMLAHPTPAAGTPTPPLGPGMHGDGEIPAPTAIRAAQGVLADGTLLDDVTGWRFLVAAQPDILAELLGADRALLEDDALVHVFSEPRDAVRELLEQHGSHRALVVRPDRYVLGVADDGAGLHEVLGRWRAFAVTGVPAAS
jgi:3-(3-hydroxy-phenyl)propionate hydroxylase